MFGGVKSVHGKLVKEAVDHKIDLWHAHDPEAHLLTRTLIYVCVRHHHVSLGWHQLPGFLQIVTRAGNITEEEQVGVFQGASGFLGLSSYFREFIIVLLFIVLCVLLDRVFIIRCLYVIYK